MAGKRKCTKEQVEATLRKCEGQMYLTAKTLGVTYITLRNYFTTWPELAQVAREAKGVVIDKVVGKLYKAAIKGEAWAVCFLLKTQAKNRGYTERQEFRHGGDKKAPPIETKNVQMLDIDRMPLALQIQLREFQRQQEAAADNSSTTATTPNPEET